LIDSPIAYACSFNPDLIQKMGQAIALGVNQLFGTLGDLARELRYGRVEETFSEDTYPAGEIGYSYIKGMVEVYTLLSRPNILCRIGRR
jgi:beta-glucosidase